MGRYRDCIVLRDSIPRVRVDNDSSRFGRWGLWAFQVLSSLGLCLRLLGSGFEVWGVVGFRA